MIDPTTATTSYEYVSQHRDELEKQVNATAPQRHKNLRSKPITPNGPSIDVVMPKMGDSIPEGTIVRWLKKVGDQIALDEALFEISTDKVDAEIPSPGAGVLAEIRAKEGETVPVNTVVAVIRRTIDLTLPELGVNIAAGDVLRVLVTPGDTLAEDQAVLELETDKATIEIPSSVAGRVTTVNVKAGDKIKVGHVILTVIENVI